MPHPWQIGKSLVVPMLQDLGTQARRPEVTIPSSIDDFVTMKPKQDCFSDLILRATALQRQNLGPQTRAALSTGPQPGSV